MRSRRSTPSPALPDARFEPVRSSVDPVLLAVDVGPVRYKQILQKLIRAEQAQ